MLQITYISSAVPGIDPTAVEQILASSRRRNAANHITGLLIHDGRRFLQALEGEAALVEATFARIQLDRRHRAAVILSKRDVALCEFGDWAMACHEVRQGSDKGSMIDAVDALTADVPDANTRELFRSFARIERRAA